jgi:hypothetical protein
MHPGSTLVEHYFGAQGMGIAKIIHKQLLKSSSQALIWQTSVSRQAFALETDRWQVHQSKE